MIEGLKFTISGTELKEALEMKASLFKAKAVQFPEPNDASQAAALLSFCAEHIEENEMYRLPLEAIQKLELFNDRLV